MTILSELVEKKDVMLYIKFRIEYLSNNLRKTILASPPEDREKVKQRIVGRIKELKVLMDCVHRNEVKKMSKIYFGKNEEENDERLSIPEKKFADSLVR